MSIGIIIAAGGTGKRLKTEAPKQFLLLNQKPIIWYCLHTISQIPSSIKEIVCVLPPNQFDYASQEINTLMLEFPNLPLKIVKGGLTRFESVKNGFFALTDNLSHVLIHDAARPLATPKLFDQVINAIQKNPIAVPGITIQDTIKEMDPDKLVIKTLNRSKLTAVQTPQGFKYEILKNLYEKEISMDMNRITDEAMLAEINSQPVKIIDGEHQNIKITYTQDFSYAEHLLQSSQS